MGKGLIFISYSRKDLKRIKRLVGDIEEKTNARCWIDWNGIESGDQFTDVIVRAIDRSDMVLFVLSDNSMNSEFAKMEVNYAKNTGKRIVPVIIDGGKLRGWFLFMFGHIDYTDYNEPLQVHKMLANITSWLGYQTAEEEDTTADVEEEAVLADEGKKAEKTSGENPTKPAKQKNRMMQFLSEQRAALVSDIRNMNWGIPTSSVVNIWLLMVSVLSTWISLVVLLVGMKIDKKLSFKYLRLTLLVWGITGIVFLFLLIIAYNL